MSAAIQINEMPVSWRLDDLDVNATLTLPQGAGPFPAVVFVAGSGPTDRNWNTPLLPGTNGSAALLAAAITAHGFATLRYDKRPSGPHANENAMKLMGKISMQSHLDELAGGVSLLAARADVDPRRIFILGNSEGCVHALNYALSAADPAAAGLILTAPPARSVGEVARSQVAAQVTPIPGGDAWLAAYDTAIADFTAGRPVTIDPSLPQGLRDMIAAVSNPVNQPFAGELWAYDAATRLERVRVPVLVIIGKKDIQVSWQADGGLIEPIAQAHDHITYLTPENASHVLKYEPRDITQVPPNELLLAYSSDDTGLDPEALKELLDWLDQQR